MPANYDNSAWFYDRLSRLIYGKNLIRAQVYLLHHIPQGSNILIVGGGTGWILEEITKLYPFGLNITYVEISIKMMALSCKRNSGGNKVIYINEAVENVSFQTNFDVAITPFLFDNFTEQTQQKVFAHIHNHLKPAGLWLNADFQLTGKWWQTFLLRSMILFFGLICGIESKQLPDTKKIFEQHGYTIVDQISFFGKFILSTIYQNQKTYEILKNS